VPKNWKQLLDNKLQVNKQINNFTNPNFMLKALLSRNVSC